MVPRHLAPHLRCRASLSVQGGVARGILGRWDPPAGRGSKVGPGRGVGTFRVCTKVHLTNLNLKVPSQGP